MLKTIGDVVDLIHRMTTSANHRLATHGYTLLGPRVRGSTTKYGLETLPHGRLVVDKIWYYKDRLERVEKGVRLLEVHAPELEGVLGAVSYRQVKEKGLVPGERDGPHGPELYLNMPVTWLISEPYVAVIVGPPADGFEDPALDRVVYTWHPGPPLKPYRPGVNPIDPLTGVKLNGR